MGGGGKKSPEVLPAPEAEPIPTPEMEAEPVAEEIRESEARKLRNRRGAAGTILTSPLGVTNNDDTLIS